MRNAFADELTKLASKDQNIILLTGDMGNRLFDTYKDQYPERFHNCGIAEANMTSMAAGMSMCGLKPVTYTIAPFNTLRCLEQIKLDICYHNLHVIIVGVGGGLSYAGLGATHHSCEDIAILRVLPNIAILCPGDAIEVRLALRAAFDYGGPVYIRLGKKNEPVIHKSEPEFEIGKGIIVSEGKGVCILSTGNTLPIALETSEILEKNRIVPQVVSMHTVKPLNTEFLAKLFNRFELVTTIEEHSLIGGLGSSIAEWLSDQIPPRGRLCRIGITDQFIHNSGNQDNARNICGLSPIKIADKILSTFHPEIILKQVSRNF